MDYEEVKEFLRAHPEYARVTPDAIYVRGGETELVISGNGNLDFTTLSDEDVNEIICVALDPSSRVNPEMN